MSAPVFIQLKLTLLKQLPFKIMENTYNRPVVHNNPPPCPSDKTLFEDASFPEYILFYSNGLAIHHSTAVCHVYYKYYFV